MGSAIGGIAGGIFGGSNTPAPPNIKTWQPSGTNQFDTLYQNIVNSNSQNNPYTQYAPYATNTFNQAYNNPYAGSYQTAANNAGAGYGTVGNTALNNAATLSSTIPTTLGAANNILNMGLDPQNDLYGRMLQQLTDQVNVNEAGRGITNSPYGASIMNNALSNFNIDWQNNQLQRALQGLSGYNSGVQNANATAGNAQNVGSAGASAVNNSGVLPFDAANYITGAQSSALGNLMNVIGNPGAATYNNAILGSIMPYLKLGAGQANQQGNFDLSNYEAALAASQNQQQGIAGMASGLFNALNGGSFGANSIFGGSGANGGAGGFGGMLNSIIPSMSSISSMIPSMSGLTDLFSSAGATSGGLDSLMAMAPDFLALA